MIYSPQCQVWSFHKTFSDVFLPNTTEVDGDSFQNLNKSTQKPHNTGHPRQAADLLHTHQTGLVYKIMWITSFHINLSILYVLFLLFCSCLFTFQKCFVDYKTSFTFPSAWDWADRLITHFGWAAPLIIMGLFLWLIHYQPIYMIPFTIVAEETKKVTFGCCAE